jgi:hypothetical protein
MIQQKEQLKNQLQKWVKSIIKMVVEDYYSNSKKHSLYM